MPDEILALDYGDARIGVARANTVARIPEPLPIINGQANQSEIFDSIIAHRPDVIIIGIPRNLSAEETSQSKSIRQFATQLKSQVDPVQVVEADETLSTAESDKWRARYPKADEDSLAACIILERYLEAGA